MKKYGFSADLVEIAKQCETADELIEVASEQGIELTVEEANAYLADIQDFELDDKNKNKVGGGDLWNFFLRFVKMSR